MIMHSNRQRRRGVSLVELVVVIGASAALFGVGTVAFTRFLAIRRGGQDHLDRTVQTVRLAEQFRHDVWASQDVAGPPESADKLTLTAGESRRIDYELGPSQVRRTILEKDKPPSHASFQLPTATPLRFEIEPAGAARKVALLVAPLHPNPVEGTTAPGKPLRIAATLGRDSRFLSPPEDR